MAFYNFKVVGTITFGASSLDKGTIIIDNEDANMALDMYDATGEILGFLSTGYFDREIAENLSNDFNSKFSNPDDEFSPYMVDMREQGNISRLIDISGIFSFTIIFVFVVIMSIVLWNTGLIAGLRRYGEVGVRLAIGEDKGHVYRSMINESIAVGLAGSVAGTIVGLIIAYIVQTKGIDVSQMMEEGAVMMPNVFRARITPPTFYIGFIPGVFSIVLGTMLSGIVIYKLQTAQLFKELE
jgi:putative ABC transport system permease protein